MAAIAVIAFGTPFALALAWLLARGRFPGKALLEALVHLPLVLPPVVTGYALLVMFGRQGPLGRWLHDTLGLSLVFTLRGAVLAAAVMALPLMVRAMRLSIEAVDRRLEAAARTLGASRPGVVRHDHAAADARRACSSGAVLGFAALAGRIRRDHHLRLQHARRDADAAAGDLQRAAGSPAAMPPPPRVVIWAALLAFGALGLAQWCHRRLQRWLGQAP